MPKRVSAPDYCVIARTMDVLGEQMDIVSAKAERATLAIIDEAVARKLARPMQR